MGCACDAANTRSLAARPAGEAIARGEAARLLSSSKIAIYVFASRCVLRSGSTSDTAIARTILKPSNSSSVVTMPSTTSFCHQLFNQSMTAS